MRPVKPAAARWRIGVGALALALLCAPARAEMPLPPARPTQNMFGMTGLIDMPSALMQPDGQVGFTTSYFAGFTRFTLSAQILPGVEAAFRYSILNDFFDARGDDSTLYDRSFDLKLRLLPEGEMTPALAIGLQDFLGTGVFSGEYVVATKSLFDGRVSATAGVGWGRFASLNGVSNPFCDAFDRFCDRNSSSDFGGNVNFGEYFSGRDVGFFGGVEWRTPVKGLSAKLEYSNDDYARERRFADFDPSFPINMGLQYRPVDWAEFGLFWMYGAAVGASLTVSGNPFRPAAPAENEPGPLAFLPRPRPADLDRQAGLGAVEAMIDAQATTIRFAEAPVADVTVETRLGGVRWASATLPESAGHTCPTEAAAAIDAEFGVLDALTIRHADGTVVCTLALRPAGREAIRLIRRASLAYPTDWHDDPERRAAALDALATALAADGIGLFAADLGPDRITVHVENPKFAETPQAIGRTARALARSMPPSVATFEIVPTASSLGLVAVTLDRALLEDQVNRADAARDAWVGARVADAPPRTVPPREGVFPRFSWAINPNVPVSLFDPDEPLRADLNIAAGVTAEVLPGLSFTGVAQKRIVGMLDDITRESDSQLPRVRSDFAEFLREGDPGITRLTADYVTKLAPSVYGRLSGGLLESMFGGVSGEVLWQPVAQPWGVGIEINYARQRDFDMRFGFQDLDAVTGHASFYWDTGFHGMQLQLDAGRYLAEDWGGTVTLTRRFANGWEIGAFATFTDVSFDEFGEGSFDKGLILTIPLNWALPYETRSRFTSVIRPLTRDGGQRLGIANRLHPTVRETGRAGLRRDWGSFWE